MSHDTGKVGGSSDRWLLLYTMEFTQFWRAKSRIKKSSDAILWIDFSQYPESKILIGLSRKEDSSHFNSIR